MPAFFSSDGPYLLQFLVIFAVIVGLMMVGYLVYRRVAGRGLSLSARAGSRSRQPRLGIVDIYELDRQRQLILLRRDNVEHLLLVGGPNDVVVERNVQRGGGARLPAEAVLRPEPAPDLPHDDRDAASEQALFPPRFEIPVTVPPAGSSAEVRPPALDESLLDPEPRQPAAAETGARARAGRFLRRTPPPLVNPRPETRAATAEGTPPVMSVGEPGSVDPAILSDMARQLEVALRRPSSAVTPPPGQAPRAAAPTPPEAKRATFEPSPPEPLAAADPIAAGMAASQVLSPSPQPPPPSPGSLAPPPAEPRPELPPAAPPDPPAPASELSPPPPAPSPAEPPKVAQAGTAFSVEEIEAEFARLLGRSLDKKN